MKVYLVYIDYGYGQIEIEGIFKTNMSAKYFIASKGNDYYDAPVIIKEMEVQT